MPPALEPLPERDGAMGDAQRAQTGWDDEDHHYRAVRGEIVGSGYIVLESVAQGTFGSVYRGQATGASVAARDKVEDVALKFIRAIPKYTSSAQVEMQVLRALNASDTGRKKRCCQLVDHFMHRGHVVMVFPFYGQSLFDLLRQNHYVGYNEEWTLEFSRYIARSIAYVHAQHIMHTDIKPENIVATSATLHTLLRGRQFYYPRCGDLMLIDFGSAISCGAPGARPHLPPLVCTRQYRPPEVLLGLQYGMPVDTWSYGCLVYEVFSGQPLFSTHRNTQHLAMLEKLLGPAPPAVLQRLRDRVADTGLPGSECGAKYFDEAGAVIVAGLTEKERAGLDRAPTVAQMRREMPATVVELVLCCLHWIPECRVTMEHLSMILDSRHVDYRILSAAGLTAEQAALASLGEAPSLAALSTLWRAGDAAHAIEARKERAAGKRRAGRAVGLSPRRGMALGRGSGDG